MKHLKLTLTLLNLVLLLFYCLALAIFYKSITATFLYTALVFALLALDRKTEKRIYFWRLEIALVAAILHVELYFWWVEKSNLGFFLLVLALLGNVVLITLTGLELIKCLQNQYGWTFYQLNTLHLIFYSVLGLIIYILGIYSITAHVEIDKQKELKTDCELQNEKLKDKQLDQIKLKEELKWRSDFLSDYQDKEKIWKHERDSLYDRLYELEATVKYGKRR